MNIGKKIIWIIGFFLLLTTPAIADFFPADDINLEGLYNITNATQIFADEYCFNNGTCFGIGNLQVVEGDTILIDWVTVLLALSFVILIFGIRIEDFLIMNLGSIFMIVVGVFLISDGIQGISNLTVDAFGMILIGIGAYVLMTSSYEIYKNM